MGSMHKALEIMGSPPELEAASKKRSEQVRIGANIASLARVPLSFLCAAGTMSDQPSLGANLLLESTDLEGAAVRRWGEASSEDSIKDTSGFISGLRDVLKGDESLRSFLLNINGAWVDERTDKYAQHVRRAALVCRGTIDSRELLIPLVRDGLMSDARELYAELGVSGVESAKVFGKLKTAAMAGSFAVAATNLRRSRPGAVKAAFTAGTLLSVASGVHYVYEFEKAYRQHAGKPPATIPETISSGLRRTINFSVEKRQKQVRDIRNSLSV
jgi:hypothetical protein